jgi:hypothetical protein
VREYSHERQGEHAAMASIAREFAILNARQGFLVPGQQEALLQHLRDRCATMTRFAAITGWSEDDDQIKPADPKVDQRTANISVCRSVAMVPGVVSPARRGGGHETRL